MKLSSNLPSVQTVPSLEGALPANMPRSTRTLPVGFDSDMKGADLDALMRFNETLPQPAKVKGKLPKKPGEADALGDTSEVVSDTPEWLASDTQEWQVAQAEIGAGAGAAAGGASTGGAGAAGAGAAGAGAAAGAGSAVAIVSPLAFTPSLLLINGGDNRAPTATFTTAQQAVEDAAALEGQLTSTDPDGVSPLTTYQLVGENIAGLTIQADGRWTFDPGVEAYQYLAQGEQLPITVTYQVTDPSGATDTETFDITVTGTNDTPVATFTTTQTASEDDETISGQLTSTDVDVLGTTATYALVGDDIAGLTIEADGSWTFDPADEAYQSLADGEEKHIIVTYQVADDHGATDTESFTITLTGTNDVPVLTVEHPTVYLEVNAEPGEIACATPEATDTDVDDHTPDDTLSYHFWVNGERVNTDGLFSIDADTGRISLTEVGAQQAGVGSYDLACASYTVQVVAYDGIANSNVETIRIERTLPDLLPQGTDTLYSLSAMLATDGEDYPYADGQVKLNQGGHHPVLTIDDTANVDVDSLKSFDILDLDIVGDMQAFSVEKAGASNDLLIKLQRQDDDEAGCLIIKDHYAKAGEANGAMEYIHFDHDSSYAGYQLSGTAQETLEACDTSYFPENGSYRISTAVATKDDDQLVGTACNDLIAGSAHVKEHLSGGNGNDLLFASGCADSLEGGAGNDLLVMDGDHGRVVFSSAANNGRDTVANFDDDHEILLKQEGLSVDALTEEDEGVFCTNLVDEIVLAYAEDSSSVLVLGEEAASAAVIAMEADTDVNPFNLHTWITSLEEEPEIQGIEVQAGASQYFLVEDADGNTQLYLGSDQGSDGMLTIGDFTHMAQFTGTGIDAFTYHNVLFAEPQPAPVL